ncbi:MAG: VWA domain-containing protein, partial [Pseudanabaena sp. M151S2SP2A07QC]|nr:VWA domain-containing protein [Pseudanabaena sp. M151S2SP2A07QC]
MSSKFKSFTVPTARMMPVIILADVSGSMTKQGKIAILNRAIATMIQEFKDDNSALADIHVAVISFGKSGAVLHIPLTPAS